MQIDKQSLIGDIVAHNYKTASVFKRYNLDFCCNGNRALYSVCHESNIRFEKLVQELNDCLDEQEKTQDYQSWNIATLSDYIYDNHHRYVEKMIPQIKEHLSKIKQVHGKKHPELLEIEAIFNQAADDLVLHMKKEEFTLFPYFKKLEQARDVDQSVTSPQFKKLDQPIAVMHQEHDMEGKAFEKIADLSNNYTLPKDACNTYRVAFAMLQDFEKDLHKHIHLENNILFKKAIALEAEMKA